MPLFKEEEEDHYKSKRLSNFWNNHYIELEVMVIEIKNYH